MINKENEIFDILIKHIEYIFDKEGNIIPFTKLEFKREKRKYSSNVSTVLYIDDKPCTGYEMKSFKIQYLCRCGKHVTILLHKYMNKKRIICMSCMQDRSFKDHVSTHPYSLQKKIRIKQQITPISFDNMDDEFKENYNKNHLTYKEFYEYLPYIFRLNNIILNDKIRNSIKYKYAERCNNQKLFTSKISFDNIHWSSIHDIALKCNICGKIFKIHLTNIKNKQLNDIKCRKCNFTNADFSIKLYNNTCITYQSLLEKDFLDKCFKYNIKVINGIEIPYIFKNKLHTYITDFYLPEYKYIVELKGQNNFYKNDIISGKIKCKNNAAIQFANSNNMKFKFVLDSELNDFILSLLNERDSLNNNESY